jgi:hypothetical protein
VVIRVDFMQQVGTVIAHHRESQVAVLVMMIAGVNAGN